MSRPAEPGDSACCPDRRLPAGCRRDRPLSSGRRGEPPRRSLASIARSVGPRDAHAGPFDAEVRRWFNDVVLPTNEYRSPRIGPQPVALMVLEDDWIDRNQLYVDAGRTGHGIGSTLLEYAKAIRPHGLQLLTFQANTDAHRFYERHGLLGSTSPTATTRNAHPTSATSGPPTDRPSPNASRPQPGSRRPELRMRALLWRDRSPRRRCPARRTAPGRRRSPTARASGARGMSSRRRAGRRAGPHQRSVSRSGRHESTHDALTLRRARGRPSRRGAGTLHHGSNGRPTQPPDNGPEGGALPEQ